MQTFFREELFPTEDPGWLRPNKGVNVMLVLSRKSGERILIGDDIKITIVRIGPNSVRIGVDAPDQYSIVREELCQDSSHSPVCSGESSESASNPPTLPR
jgi:carbon storage regulator